MEPENKRLWLDAKAIALTGAAREDAGSMTKRDAELLLELRPGEYDEGKHWSRLVAHLAYNLAEAFLAESELRAKNGVVCEDNPKET